MKRDIIRLIEERYSREKFQDLTYRSYIQRFVKTDKLCIFGAGIAGISDCYRLLSIGVRPDFFCDNDERKVGRIIVDGIRCVSFQELLSQADKTAVIISVGSPHDIEMQLIENSITKFINRTNSIILRYSSSVAKLSKEDVLCCIKKLLAMVSCEISLKIIFNTINNVLDDIDGQVVNYDYGSIYSGPQYFPDDFAVLSKSTSFIDCGAFIGDTLKCMFEAGLASRLSAYYGYELDVSNYEHLVRYLHSIEHDSKGNFTAYNIGVGKECKDIKYSPLMSDSKISSHGECVGSIVSLDQHHKEKVDYIKMDVEGAELDALYGAENLIQSNKSTLAICVYHSFSHLWEIPLHIKKVVSEYTIRFRHHSKSLFETVCYATVDK